MALAINFAQLGQRVLLIDADMRKPSIHKNLVMGNERGLSNLLTGDMQGNEMLIQATKVPNLSVLTAGPTPPDPVELLMGPKFGSLLEKAQELGFSQVVIDGPPLLGIADAVVLGNQIQHIVFAVKASGTKKASIKDSLRRLRMAGIAPMGVVLTHARGDHSSDYAYEAYYGYGNEVAPRNGAVTKPALRREPSLGKAEGPGAAAASAPGPAMGMNRSGPEFFKQLGGRKPARNMNWVWVGGASAVALLAALTWVLWPTAVPEPAVAQTRVSGVVQGLVPPPAAPAQEAPAMPAPAAAVAPAEAQPVKAGAEDPAETQAPALASLKDGPTDTWPALARLWGVSFDPNGACDNAIAAGLQCFRLPSSAKLSDLRSLDRPGLVQLKDGDTQRWVMLRALGANEVTLVSGPHTWRLSVAAFEIQWTGGFSTLWRLPGTSRERVFAARENDAGGQWLDTQLKALQSRQKLDATADSFDARVRQFQVQYRVPGSGRATPPTFLTVNRLVDINEPRLATGG